MNTNYEPLLNVTKKSMESLLRILDKADVHVKEKGIAESELLAAKLYEDMMNFTKQVQVATDYARKDLALLSGKEPVKMEDTETTIAQLKDRVQKSLAIVNTFTVEDFANADTQEVRLFWFKGTHMKGKDFLNEFAISNFLFHVVTAYDILRNQGVNIGKADFIGEMTMHPDTSAQG
jgi:uncharacterized protein